MSFRERERYPVASNSSNDTAVVKFYYDVATLVAVRDNYVRKKCVIGDTLKKYQIIYIMEYITFKEYNMKIEKH